MPLIPEPATAAIVQACVAWLKEPPLKAQELTAGQVHILPPDRSEQKPTDWPELVYTPQPQQMLFDQHFRVAADLLVIDRRLGTVGLFYVIAASASDTEKVTRKAIEQAAYLRHLCLVQADSAPKQEQAMTVELVLCLVAAAGAAVQQTLGTLLREAEYLHGIGVNLLYWKTGIEPPVEPPVEPEEIAHACCWLLPQTRRWFAELPTRNTPPPGGWARAVALNNWRLAGPRRIELASPSTLEAWGCSWPWDLPAPVQLIHGPNGSGKSALTEAFEALTVGSIERLVDPSDRNSGDKPPPINGQALVNIANESATASLWGTLPGDAPASNEISVLRRWSVDNRVKAQAKITGPESIKKSESKPQRGQVLSFCLNTKTFAWLVDHETSPEARARLFLLAFFAQYKKISRS